MSYGPLFSGQKTDLAISQKLQKLGCYGNFNVDVHVVVNFLWQLIIIFLLFLGMLMYANELKQRKNKINGNKKLTVTYTLRGLKNVLR